MQALLPPSSVVTGELDTLDDADAEVVRPGAFMTKIDLMGQQPGALTEQLPAVRLDGNPLPPLLVSFAAVRTRCRVTQLM